MRRLVPFWLIALIVMAVLVSSTVVDAQQAAPVIPNPTGRDMFQLDDVESWRQFSSVKNFDVVGHSYFRGP